MNCVADSAAGTGEVRAAETSAVDNDEEIEVIRCICNIYRDEGLMIQCDRCEVTFGLNVTRF